MDEIDRVLAECTRIENEFRATLGARLAPAPGPFKRAAILCRKANDKDGEIAICRRWIELESQYSRQPHVRAGRAVNVAAGPVARHIRERLRKLEAKR